MLQCQCLLSRVLAAVVFLRVLLLLMQLLLMRQKRPGSLMWLQLISLIRRPVVCLYRWV